MHTVQMLQEGRGEAVWTVDEWQRRFVESFRSLPLWEPEIHLHNNDGQKDMHWFLEDGDLVPKETPTPTAENAQ